MRCFSGAIIVCIRESSFFIECLPAPSLSLHKEHKEPKGGHTWDALDESLVVVFLLFIILSTSTVVVVVLESIGRRRAERSGRLGEVGVGFAAFALVEGRLAGRSGAYLAVVCVLDCVWANIPVVGREKVEAGEEVLGACEVLARWRRGWRAAG